MPIPLHAARRRDIYYVAGCKAVEGVVKKKATLRLVRDGKVVHECSGAASMKHFKDDVREIKKGNEFAMQLSGDPPPTYLAEDEIHCIQYDMVKQSIFDYENFRY